MIKIILPLLLILSCVDIIIKNERSYNSIKLGGGSWIELPYEKIYMSGDTEISTRFKNYLSILNNSFTIQMIFSGDSVSTNDQLSLLSIVNSNEEIIFSLLREPNQTNSVVLYKDNERVGSYEVDDLDWPNCSEFYLLSIVQDKEQESISIFINETIVTTISGSIDNTSKSSISIGGISNSERTIAQNFWHGYIDEFRIWDTNLSSESIIFHNSNRDKISEYSSSSYLGNLYGHWDCNLSGSNFNDSLGTSIYSTDGIVELSENGTN